MIADTVPANGIVTADEGRFHALLARRRWPARSLICPVGMEAPGYSLPAAIGAKLADPKRPVVSINGAGGLQRNAQELAVCAIHKIALKIAVFPEADAAGIGSPDFVKLAEAFGLKGLRAERPDEARDVWMHAMKAKGPVLVDFAFERSGK
nr:thiamine pyrophosphate-dependent enzyme [Cohnella sp. CFH 77786]